VRGLPELAQQQRLNPGALAGRDPLQQFVLPRCGKRRDPLADLALLALVQVRAGLRRDVDEVPVDLQEIDDGLQRSAQVREPGRWCRNIQAGPVG
jgi:hypothetical protein